MAISNQQIVDWLKANPEADDATIAKTMTANGVTADQLASATGADPKEVATRFLTQQILAQGVTSKWKGEGKGSAEANARDMAQIMADTGITDIKQFGQVTQTIPGYSYETEGGTVDVPEQTYTTYGNKATGQAVENTYGERQSGNAFGGTYTGEGNTGYRVQFDAQGNPVFYTTAASSNTLQAIMEDLGPLGNIALALATGGLTIPQQIAANLAFQVLSGKDIGEAVKSAAISMAVSNIPGTDLMKEANKYIAGLDLPVTVTNTINNAVQSAVSSGVRAALTNQDIGDAMLRGAAAGGTNGAVSALLKEVDGFGDLTGAQKRMVVNAVTGAISGKPLDQLVINAAIATANAEIADQKKYPPISDKDYGFLSDAEKKVYDESGTKALFKYQSDIGASNKIDKLLTGINAGATDNTDSGLSNQDILDMIGAGSLTGAAGNDTVTDITETGLGDQDVLDVLNASSVVGGGGNDAVVGGGGNDAVVGGGGNDDTVSITGGAGNDTLTETDTITGAGGNDVITGGGGNDNLTITGERDANGCLETEYWDPVLESCQLKVLDTVTGGGGNDATVTVTGERDANGCLKTEYWDPVLESCQLKVVDTVTGGSGNDDTVTVVACGPGKVRNAAGDCVDIDCGDGKYWDPITGQCELKAVTTVTCGPNEELGPDGITCLTKCAPGYKRGADGITCELETVEVKACLPGKVRNAAGDCVDIDCGDGKYWDPITGQCELKAITTVTCGADEEKSADGLSCLKKCAPGYKRGADGITCELETVVVKDCLPGTERGPDGITCIPICEEGYVRGDDGITCVKKPEDGCGPNEELGPDGITCLTKCGPGFKRGADGITCVPEIVIKDCLPGTERGPDGITCIPICEEGYVRGDDGITCVKKPDDDGCGPNEELGPDGITCLTKCGPGYKRGDDGITCVAEVVITACGPGKVRNEAGDCVDIDCGPGKYWDPITNQCELSAVIECDPGFEKVNGACVAVCQTGYVRNAATGVCEKPEDKGCPPGQVKDANGKCVPIVTPPPPPPPPVQCPTGFTLVNGVCVQKPTLPDAPVIGPYVDTSTTSPVYAGAMDDFDFLATLQDILGSDNKKKSTQQGQQPTKMATGGHLDDLLAEQITVDDLLKLLR